MQNAVMCTAREGLARCTELGPKEAAGFDASFHPTLADLTAHAGPTPHLVLFLLPAKKAPGKAAKIPVPFPMDSGVEVGAFEAITIMLEQRLGLRREDLFDSEGRVNCADLTLPLFVDRAGAAMTKGAMSDCFTSAAIAIELKGKATGHAGRIGGATDHFAADTPPAILQICGRWDSDLWQIYTLL